MSINEAFAADAYQPSAPAGVIADALRWEILDEWTRYLRDPQFADKTAEMSYRWGFINRDFGGETLRCLWEKWQTNYPMFAETAWLLRRDFSDGAGAENHPVFHGVPPVPETVLWQKIASASLVARREKTEEQLVEILGAAAQEYPQMR